MTVDIEVQRQVMAPAEVVWDLWANVEGSPRWDREVLWSRLEGDFEAGTSGIFKVRKGPLVKFELTRVEPHRSYLNVAHFPGGLELTFGHRIEEAQPSSCRVFHGVTFNGRRGKLAKVFLGSRLRSAFEMALCELAILAERCERGGRLGRR